MWNTLSGFPRFRLKAAPGREFTTEKSDFERLVRLIEIVFVAQNFTLEKQFWRTSLVNKMHLT